MSIRLTFALLLSMVSTNLIAQTMVSGGIYSNATWSLANSPYIVTGNVVVFPGKTLTIEPGVQVRVQGTAASTQTNPGISIEIRGRLVAIGTASAPIIFQADSILAYPFTWAGILVKASQGGDGDINYVHLSNAYTGFGADNLSARTDTVHFADCIFTDNVVGIAPFFHSTFRNCSFERNQQAMSVLQTAQLSVGIFNCDFDDNHVCLGYNYDVQTIDSCNFRNNAFPLIVPTAGPVTNSLFEGNQIAVQRSLQDFSNCRFVNNQRAITEFAAGSVTNCVFLGNGVAMEVYPGATLQGNEISGNSIGVKISDNVGGFQNNRICGNTLYNVENSADKNINLVGNCFCESDSTAAEALLFDGYDDITRGLFNYALYDSSCTNIVQLVTKVTIVTGIPNQGNAQLVVYPNPAQDYLEVRVSGPSAAHSLCAS